MVAALNELSDQDFFFSYLAEYLDGDLPAAAKVRFEQILRVPGQELLLSQFQTLRGQLQFGLQSYYLKENELHAIRSCVQDPAITATKENIRIDQLGRRELWSSISRRLLLTALAAAVIGLLVWRFVPSNKPRFKPLEYLGYEALAMEADPEGRLDLPSFDLKEVKDYLATYPGLEFRPRLLHSFGEGWKLDGATIIDYEIAKVAAVQYSNKNINEKLVHFSFAGQLGDLPRAETGNMKGLNYQAYASDQLNLIAWQHGSGVVSLLVGRRSAPELAEIAVLGGSKDNTRD